jgi:hypothetical protein
MLLGGRGISAKPNSRSVTWRMVGRAKNFSRLSELELVLDSELPAQVEL